jgi:hypothetical protein
VKIKPVELNRSAVGENAFARASATHPSRPLEGGAHEEKELLWNRHVTATQIHDKRRRSLKEGDSQIGLATNEDLSLRMHGG